MNYKIIVYPVVAILGAGVIVAALHYSGISEWLYGFTYDCRLRKLEGSVESCSGWFD